MRPRTARTAIRLRCGRSTFTLSALPPEEFPELSKTEFACRFQLAAEDLRGLIDRTGFAASTEETRYYLNGIYLHTTEHEGVPVLRAVATDGHRLARVRGAEAGRRGGHAGAA